MSYSVKSSLDNFPKSCVASIRPFFLSNKYLKPISIASHTPYLFYECFKLIRLWDNLKQLIGIVNVA